MALSLQINGKVIQNVNCCKYLSMMIDNDLKWKKTSIISIINVKNLLFYNNV